VSAIKTENGSHPVFCLTKVDRAALTRSDESMLNGYVSRVAGSLRSMMKELEKT